MRTRMFGMFGSKKKAASVSPLHTVAGVALAGAAAFTVLTFPQVVRYLKMKSM